MIGAQEQLHAERLLQRLYCLGDGGLAQAQRFGRLDRGSVLGDLVEYSQ